ncbi:hypothetical protein SBRY_20708 [Actinacidiphila bryophytorum]|uniref:Uncharacterized protein n=1 Tax=Actinacidiphila bryophytorum TaxID=1436133 RepID=A0A9W4EDV0_9ACTN|nr:hypothetical protein SBRY_20708 [Actinacidiphila bryophytorum]
MIEQANTRQSFGAVISCHLMTKAVRDFVTGRAIRGAGLPC